MADERPVILTLLGVFQPGFDATGPNQSLLRMAEALSDRFRFRVIAMAAAGDIPGRWTSLHGVDRLPLVSRRWSARGLRKALAETPHALLVSNGMFDLELTVPALVYRRFGLIPRRPIMVAPRGEFSPGALALKGGRKRAFLRAAAMAGLLRDVAIQATTPQEAIDLESALPATGPILLGPNIRPLPSRPPHLPRPSGAPLRVAFLSRIDRKKNLDFALRALAAARSTTQFDIYGPVTDQGFWTECQALIAGLPPHVSATWHGAVPQEAVPEVLARSDLFFLPTLGENYGHAIVDALSAGTPVLLSRDTPWRDLAAHRAGWDLPLDDIAPFAAAIDEMAALPPAQAAAMRDGARAYIAAQLDQKATAGQLEQCFRRAMTPAREVRAIERTVGER